MNVVLYASYCVKENVFGFSNFVFEVTVKALFNMAGQYGIVVLGVPGHVKVNFTIDVLRHLAAPEKAARKRPDG